ncbi:hypothetical protein [Runella sp.]|uniref:hypothetical protein n=1 Tax=Runella sp. TaxID=1960881 RepID=UPI00301A9919
MNDYQILGLRDLISLFLYTLLYLINRNRIRKITNNEFHLFEKGLCIWLIGNSSFFLLFYLYYGWGDTFNYYFYGLHLLRYLIDYPSAFLEIYFSDDISQLSLVSYPYYSFMPNVLLMNNHANFFVAKVISIGLIFTLGSYITLSFILTLFSFTGCWLIYTVFRNLYPAISSLLYYSTLLLPNLIFWGNGITKEALYFGGMGFTFFNFYRYFILKQKGGSVIILIISGSYIIYSVKSYVFYCFFPSLLLWILLRYSYQDKRSQKMALLLLFSIILFTLGLSLVFDFNSLISSLAINSILESAQNYGNQVYELSEISDGSSYTLSEFEPSVSGTIGIIPEIISTALFRPYIWEIKKPINLFNALEGLLLMGTLIYLFIKIGIWTIAKIIIKSPNILFCFAFSLIFLTGVGISSLNFGALVRYKLPGEVFFIVGLCIIYHEGCQKLKLNEENNTIYYN